MNQINPVKPIWAYIWVFALVLAWSGPLWGAGGRAPEFSEKETAVLYARVTSATPIPEDIKDPYPDAVVFHRFQVLYVEKGVFENSHILAATWAKRDYKVLESAAVKNGDLFKLKVVDLDKMEAFDRIYEETQRIDTTGDYLSPPYWALDFENLDKNLSEEPDLRRNVILGKDGWLYNARFTRERPFSDAQLQKLKNVLVPIKTWLNEKGIRFFVVICPNKHWIYPEYLPGGMEKTVSDSSVRIEGLLSWFQKNTDVDVVDLRPDLLTAKKNRPDQSLYFKTDNHWNSWGAYQGYLAILNHASQWFKDMPPAIAFEDFSTRRKTMDGYMLSFTGLKGLVREPFSFVHDLNPDKKADSGKGKPRLLLIEDSFAVYLKPFLQANFELSSLYARGVIFNDSLLQRYQPEIVIIQQGELFLNRLDDHKPPQ